MPQMEKPPGIGDAEGLGNGSAGRLTSLPHSKRRPALQAIAQRAALRAASWRKIQTAMGEQRAALDRRIWREDIEDTLLAADCQTWCELAQALADFLASRRWPT